MLQSVQIVPNIRSIYIKVTISATVLLPLVFTSSSQLSLEFKDLVKYIQWSRFQVRGQKGIQRSANVYFQFFQDWSEASAVWMFNLVRKRYICGSCYIVTFVASAIPHVASLKRR